MLWINDTSCCHQFSMIQTRITGNICSNSQSDWSKYRPACPSKESLFWGTNSRVRLHISFGIHERIHSICSRNPGSTCLHGNFCNFLSDGRIWRQLNKYWLSIILLDPSHNIFNNLWNIWTSSSHTLIRHSMIAWQI